MTHPRYEQISVGMRVRFERAAAKWIPFYQRFGVDYNFDAALYRDLENAKGDQKAMKLAYARSEEARRQGPAGFRNDLKLFGQR